MKIIFDKTLGLKDIPEVKRFLKHYYTPEGNSDYRKCAIYNKCRIVTNSKYIFNIDGDGENILCIKISKVSRDEIQNDREDILESIAFHTREGNQKRLEFFNKRLKNIDRALRDY
jgi:hypothetical protein